MKRFLFSLVALAGLALPAAPALARGPVVHDRGAYREAIRWRDHEYWEHPRVPVVPVQPWVYNYRPYPVVPCAPYPVPAGFGVTIASPVFGLHIGR
jgi:hypothetical protein